MKKLPIGIQSFEEIQTKNFLYIDKTEHIYRLIDSGKYYFLARPRRFGKSLLVSTLKAIFEGKKELFADLYIADKWDWETTYPVIHISFSSIGYHTAGFEDALHSALDEQAKRHNINLTSKQYDQKFKELIQTLSVQNQVVLLIDEYDKPLIDYLGEELEQAKAHQKILKNFYSVIKDSDPYLKLVFITGVSKFSKVSIFSDLNNLQDITFNWDFSTICGYTQEELEQYFEPYYTKALTRNNLSKAEVLVKLKKWYNGYSWDGIHRVYNPFSILSFFAGGRFSNFWFQTGTPTFLINLLRERFTYDIADISVLKDAIESYNIENLDSLPLLLQTGYLTIDSINIEDDDEIITLVYPNLEVKRSMLEHLIGGFRYNFNTRTTPIVHRVKNAFLDNDMATVIEEINHIFSTIPNHIFQARSEGYYHSLIHLVFTFLGIYLQSEVNTSRGRCDTVVHTNTHIYILEFKLDRSASEALAQIESRGYDKAFQQQGKSIVKVGINFDSQTKEVSDWEVA